MRDPKRIDRITKILNEMWHKYPDWRLGQLISNLAPRSRDVFFVEDDDMEKWIEAWLRGKE